MATPDPEPICPSQDLPDLPEESSPSEMPVGMTLESIIDLTNELEHLNGLVMLNLEKGGGFTCTVSYFAVVQPILDLLEVEIRANYRDGMTRDDMKRIVGDWIDAEISLLQ